MEYLKKKYQSIIKSFMRDSGQGALTTIAILVGVTVIISGSIVGARIVARQSAQPVLEAQVQHWDEQTDPGAVAWDEGDIKFDQPSDEESNQIQEILREQLGEDNKEQLSKDGSGWMQWVQGIGKLSDNVYKWVFEGPIDDIVAGNLKHLPNWAKGMSPGFARFAQSASRVLSILGGALGLWLLVRKVKNFSMDLMRSMNLKEHLIYWLEVIADTAAVVAAAAVIFGLVSAPTVAGGVAGAGVAATAGAISLIAGSLALLIDIFWPE